MEFAYLDTLAEGYDKERILEDLVLAYRNEMWDYALSLTQRPDLADDIVQDVFLKAYEKLHTFRGESTIKTWLFRITRNISFNRMKSSFFRRALLMRSIPESAQKAQSAENQVLDKLLASEAWRLVFQLPVKQRETMVLSAHHDLTHEEIASLLRVPVGTVKSRLHAARIKLASIYKGGAEHDGV